MNLRQRLLSHSLTCTCRSILEPSIRELAALYTNRQERSFAHEFVEKLGAVTVS